MIPYELFHPNEPPPESTNPADYPRAIEITDDDVILAIQEQTDARAKLEILGRQIAELQREAMVWSTKAEAAKARIFHRLPHLYPGVVGPHGEHGYRRHEDRLYYVGWCGAKAGDGP